jgi:hypothetical protein
MALKIMELKTIVSYVCIMPPARFIFAVHRSDFGRPFVFVLTPIRRNWAAFQTDVTHGL